MVQTYFFGDFSSLRWPSFDCLPDSPFLRDLIDFVDELNELGPSVVSCQLTTKQNTFN